MTGRPGSSRALLGGAPSVGRSVSVLVSVSTEKTMNKNNCYFIF